MKDSLPQQIYLDTNFVVNVFYAHTGNLYKNLACRYFIKRLLTSETKLYFSSILFPEFWHAVLKLKTAHLYKLDNERDVFQKLKEEKNTVFPEVYPTIRDKQLRFDSLLTQFNIHGQRVYVVETEKSIMAEAEKNMGKYCLQSFDAIHLTSAIIGLSKLSNIKPLISNIATLDSDFIHLSDNNFSFWCNGCTYTDILAHEKTLIESELFKDGVLYNSKKVKQK